MSKQESPSLETTHAVRDLCLCLHVQRAARAVARHYDEALKPAGLTNGQFSVMMALNREEPPTLGSVASLLAMDRTSLTAMLKPLQRRKLVRIAVNKADKRRRLLALTPAGRASLAEALPLWTAAQAVCERLLSQSGPERLRSGLRALT